jgi:hypothetical protein
MKMAMCRGNGRKTTGGTAALKIQLCFDYLRGTISALAVAGHSPDKNCRLQLENTTSKIARVPLSWMPIVTDFAL